MSKLVVILGLVLMSFSGTPFSKSGDKVTIRMHNDDMSLVTLKVRDSEGRDLFSETTHDAEIGKVFNFEKAYADDYVITVEDGGDFYRTTITVE